MQQLAGLGLVPQAEQINGTDQQLTWTDLGFKDHARLLLAFEIIDHLDEGMTVGGVVSPVSRVPSASVRELGAGVGKDWRSILHCMGRTTDGREDEGTGRRSAARGETGI